MTSFSSLYIFMVFLGSVLFLAMAFIERAIHKKKMSSPEQVIVLMFGISGIIYAALLFYFKLKSLGWLRLP